jgi:hypothetical protein
MRTNTISPASAARGDGARADRSSPQEADSASYPDALFMPR